MKTITLRVDITFSEDICDDNEIKEVTTNVFNSLVDTLNEKWLSPEHGEAITEKIVVSEQFTETELEHLVFEG